MRELRVNAMMPRRKPALSDVAEVAQVSAQTVSRVANGSTKVRPETRDRVLAAMEQVGYVPNSAARALRYGSFRTIGLLTHQLHRIGESSTVEAVVTAAGRAGYTVSLLDIPSIADFGDAAAGLAHQPLDGLIVSVAESDDRAPLSFPAHLPIVLSTSTEGFDYPTVVKEQLHAAGELVNHLLGLGHRTVHHLGGPDNSLPEQQRMAGWSKRLHELGREVPAAINGDWTSASGYERTRVIVNQIRTGEITAVFCANDQIALGAYRAIYEADLRIPQDVSVVGFDDIPEASQYWPPLTTQRSDFRAAGEAAVRMLLEHFSTGNPAVNQTVNPKLVVRASTAHPGMG